MVPVTGSSVFCRAALLLGGLALLGSGFALAMHHCELDGPDQPCDFCRTMDGNPATVFAAPPPPVVSRTIVPTPAPAPRPIDRLLPVPRGRAPPPPFVSV